MGNVVDILEHKSEWDHFRSQCERLEEIGIEYYNLQTGRKAHNAEIIELTDYHFQVSVTEWGAWGSSSNESYTIPFDYLYNYNWQIEVKEKIENDKKIELERIDQENQEEKKQKVIRKQEREQKEKELFEKLKRKYDNENHS
jgi:hypothetical protein